KVISTLIRWGNFDYFSAASRWNAGEVPADVQVPTSQALPASLYYAAKPAWWPASIAWPPIGPDVSGGNADPAGHANKIPAQLCFEQGLMPSCLAGTITPPSACDCNGDGATNVTDVQLSVNQAI